MNRTVKIGIIGLGARAETLFATMVELPKGELEVTALCDFNEAKIQRFKDIYDKHNLPYPKFYKDYKDLIKDNNVDAVLVPTSWNSHFGIARDAMAAGKYVGIEVGGASSIDELWQLVNAAESTGVSCMMLENCCYGRNELMMLNLAKKGYFGELIHCACGYEHDLSELATKLDDGIERAWHNLRRNCDLYPTHGLGPIAKILNINHGNRFLTISSTASKARGFARAAQLADGKGAAGFDTFNCGDVITSVIKCANGETITMTHSISLPRPYSRDGRVQGTKGIWLEDRKGIWLEGLSETKTEIDVAGNPYTTHIWDNVEDYYEEYDHPIWKAHRENPIGGHGGMDSLTLMAFADAVRNKVPTPIDVYDCAAWMACSCLSEQSIALGGAPVAFPDFTNGKWIYPAPKRASRWALDDIYE